MRFRQENEQDYSKSGALYQNGEAEAVRKGAGYLPELSFVAEEEGRILGHIMLTAAELTDPQAEDGSYQVLWLAALQTVQEERESGLALDMLREMLCRAMRFKHAALFALGTDDLQNLGFRPAPEFSAEGQESENTLMVRELIPGALAGVSGSVRR